MDPTTWIAILEDGTEIIQNPNDSRNSWTGLKELLLSKKTRIKEFGLKFRTHAEFLPERQPAYYFSHGIRAILAGQSTQKEYYVLGWVDEDWVLNKRWYMTPELIVDDTISEQISKQLLSEPRLSNNIIWNG